MTSFFQQVIFCTEYISPYTNEIQMIQKKQPFEVVTIRSVVLSSNIGNQKTEKQHRSHVELSERLAYLGMMRTPESTRIITEHYRFEGFKEGPQLEPHYAEKR